jgi:UrcA family protein
MFKPTFKPTLALISLTMAATGMAAPAMAQDDDAPRVEVRYGDLDLQTIDGRERLDLRVRNAIRTMCSVDPRPSLEQRAVEQACEARARSSAEPQLAALLKGSSARFASEKPPVVAAP